MHLYLLNETLPDVLRWFQVLTLAVFSGMAELLAFVTNWDLSPNESGACHPA